MMLLKGYQSWIDAKNGSQTKVFVSKAKADRCCCCDCCCCEGIGVPFVLLKSVDCWQISEDYRGSWNNMILNGITASRCLDIKIGPCYLKHCSSLRYAPLCVSATSPKFRSLSIADEGKNVLPFSGSLQLSRSSSSFLCWEHHGNALRMPSLARSNKVRCRSPVISGASKSYFTYPPMTMRRKEWPHFLRFHIIMAMLLENAYQAIAIACTWFPKTLYRGELGMHFWLAVTFVQLYTVVECMSCALCGKYADVPFVSDTAYIHSDPKIF